MTGDISTIDLNEKKIRSIVLLILVGYIVTFYPSYKDLTSLTVSSLAIVSSLYIGVIPVHGTNDIFFNFNGITPLIVSPECSGLTVITVFTAIVWLVPGISIKRRIYALLLIPVLFAVNVLRLLMAVIIGDKINVNALSIYHGTLGQLFIFVAMISCFVIFMALNRKDTTLSYVKDAKLGHTEDKKLTQI